MYLTAIFLLLLAIFILFPIFLSRRRNFKILLAFLFSFITMSLFSFIKPLHNFLLYLTQDVYNGASDFLMLRITTQENVFKFLYVNIYFVIFTMFFIIFYLVCRIFIKDKSNFRVFENKGMKITLHVSFAIINVIFFAFVIMIILVNLNQYFNMKIGFLENVFELSERVIEYL